MAFMMPVVKNDWNIYKSNRSRKTSECNTSCTTRTRKISECRSEGLGSLSTSPKLEVPLPKHHSVPDRMPSRVFPRGRTSSENLPSRAKVSFPPENPISASASNLKPSLSGCNWLDKLKKFIKHSKREEERSK
ncbi:uncharacterized protein LOC109535808 [Dendroctonus ponderosae]|uniref:uncharacterized protein LOC109535808 n=1 Tax=Dendroctonus ponderosae TaxID=77166 RepID=UPI0020354D2D|nr:uncharacterized protein LOC109535808 [Dendroctonus ponderosae]